MRERLHRPLQVDRHPDGRVPKATEGWIAMADVPEVVQRWTAKRRVALVLSIVRGETSVAEAAEARPDRGRD